MKKLFNGILTGILQFFATITLPKYARHHYHPETPYISQYVSIQPADLSPESVIDDPQLIKAFGAKNAEEFNFWMWRDCGIACVKMILESRHKALEKNMMELTEEGVSLGGYIVKDKAGNFVDKGWFHGSLVSLLQKYEVKAIKKKWQSGATIAHDILRNKHVIASLYLPTRRTIAEDGSFAPKQDATYTGHLVLITGVDISKKKLLGFFIHDPRGLPHYQSDTYITLEAFKKIFTHRTIVAI